MNIDINSVKNTFSNKGSVYNTERQYQIKTERYKIERGGLDSRLRNSE